MLTFNEVEKIIGEIECPPFVFRAVDESTYHTTNWWMQAVLWRDDTDTGSPAMGYGGKYKLSPYMTTDEIVRKCFQAALSFAEHEVRESFKWRGRRVLGPHISVERLWEIAEETTVRE